MSKRRGFGYCEVVSLEEFQDLGEFVVGDMDGVALVVFTVHLKESAVQETDFSAPFDHLQWSIPRRKFCYITKPTKERPKESVVEEVFGRF